MVCVLPGSFEQRAVILMENEIVICVPGTWENRTEFIQAVVTSTQGDFVFAGMILAQQKGKDHVNLDFCESDGLLLQAFTVGGQGKITNATLHEIARHRSLVYLHFPFDIVTQKARLLKFTEVLSNCGGLAVKLETSGIAHEWDRWFELLGSTNPFDTYSASVVLVADERFYFSCGMHNFGLPDVQISNKLDAKQAADVMNRFNHWQIVEEPILESGHTFSLTADSEHFRLELLKDKRHLEDELFHNPCGIWELQRCS